MTFRENIIIFFVPLQIAFTDCGTSEAIVDPKTDSFTDCGTQEPLWTQNCYFKCCFCACFFTAYYYLWKYPRCRSFLPKKKNKKIMWSLIMIVFQLVIFFLCYRDLCLGFFCHGTSSSSSLFASSSSLLHCTLLSSLLLPALDRRRPSYSLSFLVRASDFLSSCLFCM